MTTAGEQLALVGMGLARDAASDAWKDRWNQAIAALARTGEEFTADDVRKIAGAPTDHENAAGALFNGAARRGLIRRVGYRKSARDVLHAHPIAVWKGTR